MPNVPLSREEAQYLADFLASEIDAIGTDRSTGYGVDAESLRKRLDPAASGDFVPGWTVEADGHFVRLVKTHPDETGALLAVQARRLARLLVEASASIEEAHGGVKVSYTSGGAHIEEIEDRG